MTVIVYMFALGFFGFGILGVIVAGFIDLPTAQTFWGLSILCLVGTTIAGLLGALF